MDAAPTPAWPPGDDEMARRLRAHDWAATPLGPAEDWPQTLRAAVELMLASAQPAYIGWGGEIVSLYNDGYIPILGEKHPDALGRPYRLVWPEIWNDFEPVAAAVMAGEARYFVDQAVPLAGRPGRPMSWFTFSWTPLHDGSGLVGGFYCAAVETTERVLADQRREQFYRTMFETIDDGFALCEQLPGEPADFRYLFVNPAFERQSGLSDPVGKSLRTLVPTVEQSIIARYQAVARTGQAERFTSHVAELGRWFEVNAMPGEGPGQVAILFRDVTERERVQQALRDSEERQAFLLEVSDALRPLTSPSQVQQTAMRMLAERFNVMRAGYLDVDPDGDTMTMAARFEHDAVPVPDRIRLSDYGSDLVAAFHAGQTRHVCDTDIEAETEAQREAHRAIGVRAWIIAPLVKAGRLIAIVGVVNRSPRDWSPAQVQLVTDLAERTWDAVQRARFETALRESEERQAFLLRLSDALRPLDEPEEITGAATRLLGESVGASRAYFAEWPPDADYGEVARDWMRPGLPSLAGRYPMETFRSAHDRLSEGRTWIVEDAVTDVEMNAEEREYYVGNGVIAWVDVPLLRHGRVQAALCLVQNEARRWTAAEIAMAEQTADRCWAAIERARAETAKRESEKRFRQFGEASSDVLWIVDAKTQRLEYLSPAFEAIWGAPCATVMADLSQWAAFVHPDDREAASTAMPRALAGKATMVDYRIVRPDGGVRYITDVGFPIFGADGRVVRVGGIAQDLTDRRLAGLALRASEQRLQTLMEGVPQLVWRAVDGGHWTWASPQWTTYTGQAEADSHGRGWLDPVHPDDRERVVRVWEGAVERGEFHADYRLCSAPEHRYRWFQTRATPVRDDGGDIVEWLGTSTDVEDLRALQDRQRVLLHELQHRVRNTLAIVRSLVRRTEETTETAEEFGAHLEGRLNALARTQTVLTRAPGEGVDLDSMVREELLAQAAEDRQVTVEGPDVQLSAKAAEVLTLAIHELATNATKYGALAAAAGTIAVRWAVAQDRGEDWLTLNWDEAGVRVIAAAPRRRGFGTELITGRVPYELRGRGALDLRPGGIHAEVSFPLRPGDSILETSAPTVSAERGRP